MYVFITYIQTFFDTLEQHYATKQNTVRLPSQKYSGPKSAHNSNLTPTENRGLILDRGSFEQFAIVELQLGLTFER